MKVSYVLVVAVRADLCIEVVGRNWRLEKGYYAYIGSACLLRPHRRILRHFKPAKNKRWHIDYLTSSSSAYPIAGLILNGVTEDALYSAVAASSVFKAVLPKFGSTDKKTHTTHLFKIRSISLERALRKVLSLAFSLKPHSIELLMND